MLRLSDAFATTFISRRRSASAPGFSAFPQLSPHALQPNMIFPSSQRLVEQHEQRKQALGNPCLRISERVRSTIENRTPHPGNYRTPLPKPRIFGGRGQGQNEATQTNLHSSSSPMAYQKCSDYTETQFVFKLDTPVRREESL